MTEGEAIPLMQARMHQLEDTRLTIQVNFSRGQISASLRMQLQLGQGILRQCKGVHVLLSNAL